MPERILVKRAVELATQGCPRTSVEIKIQYQTDSTWWPGPILRAGEHHPPAPSHWGVVYKAVCACGREGVIPPAPDTRTYRWPIRFEDAMAAIPHPVPRPGALSLADGGELSLADGGEVSCAE